MIAKATFLSLILVWTTLTAAAQEVTAPAAKPEKKVFEFKDGDRLVLIGNTVIEREQRYGDWLTRVLLTEGQRNLVFDIADRFTDLRGWQLAAVSGLPAS